ncbi:MAG: hypothetical protein J7559_18650, partial [Cohnella sp.]|nr:hypothetical protein [Cohnella sp.]
MGEGEPGMNVGQSIAKLPESAARLLAASAAVRPQLERGEPRAGTFAQQVEQFERHAGIINIDPV